MRSLIALNCVCNVDIVKFWTDNDSYADYDPNNYQSAIFGFIYHGVKNVPAICAYLYRLQSILPH